MGGSKTEIVVVRDSVRMTDTDSLKKVASCGSLRNILPGSVKWRVKKKKRKKKLSQ